ncbi:MAG TPA: nuclear transport factor 2 family protein [Thermoleophilaceae bacterium]|nr:nuclear transport factor 2 family protein [Thermoleophilaceae bacterium]
MTEELTRRNPREVLDDHLRLAHELKLEEDIERNVADDCVVLLGRGVFRGHAGVRQLAYMLVDEVPSGEWNYVNTMVEGRMAFLEWTVDAGPQQVRDGADSFLIEGGKIQAQTIHYTVVDEQGRLIVRADGTRTELAG